MQFTFPGHRAFLSLALVHHDLQREIGRCQQRSNAHAGCVSCAGSNNSSGSGGTTSTPRPEGTPADAQMPYEATLPVRGWAIHYPPPSPLRRARSTGCSGRAAARSDTSAVGPAGPAGAAAAGGGGDAGAGASSRVGPDGRV